MEDSPPTKDESQPWKRRAGRMWVTPTAERILAGQTTATEDEKLLERRPRPTFLETDPWRTLRILSEFVEGFDALAQHDQPVKITVQSI